MQPTDDLIRKTNPAGSSSIRQLANSLTVLGVAYASCASAATETLPAVWATVYDFLVQDVCLDAAGQAVVGLSPLAADCSRRRDLLPGEVLPYHKADWPGDEDRQRAPAGYERSEEHTSELQSRLHLVCRLLLEKKKKRSTVVVCDCMLRI